ncbi:MAG: hypothetical protein GWP04_04620 [Gammaproteobacteria bacterium]|nr:hypothetical protein [Gammaproteobacteria bacterium]
MRNRTDSAQRLLQLQQNSQHEQGLDDVGTPHGPVVLGVTLEIPVALLMTGANFPDLEFISLDTNDLLQRAMAADQATLR